MMALGMADLRQHRPISHELVVDMHLPVNGLEQSYLIVGIVNGELAREARPDFGERVAVAAQQTHAKGMERGNERALRCGRIIQKRADALPHLFRGFVGEGDRQNRRTRNAVMRNQVRDAMRNDTCFAAAGSGEQQHWAFGMSDGFPLLRIKTFKKIHLAEQGGEVAFGAAGGI